MDGMEKISVIEWTKHQISVIVKWYCWSLLKVPIKVVSERITILKVRTQEIYSKKIRKIRKLEKDYIIRVGISNTIGGIAELNRLVNKVGSQQIPKITLLLLLSVVRMIT
jgi:hypothetical protein